MKIDPAFDALQALLGERGFARGSTLEERYRLDAVGRAGEAPMAR